MIAINKIRNWLRSFSSDEIEYKTLLSNCWINPQYRHEECPFPDISSCGICPKNQWTKFWVDDIRPAPAGFKRCTNVHEVKIHCCQLLKPDKRLNIKMMSLDHDAGDYQCMGGDYIEILKWLEEKVHTDGWIIETVFHLHSQNPVGVQNMRNIIEKNGWREAK